MQKARRSDAVVALTKAAALQERIFIESIPNKYTTSLGALGWAQLQSNNSIYTSAKYHYAMTTLIDHDDCGGAPCFKLTATARGSQANDARCQTFSLDSREQKSFTGGGDCRWE